MGRLNRYILGLPRWDFTCVAQLGQFCKALQTSHSPISDNMDFCRTIPTMTVQCKTISPKVNAGTYSWQGRYISPVTSWNVPTVMVGTILPCDGWYIAPVTSWNVPTVMVSTILPYPSRTYKLYQLETMCYTKGKIGKSKTKEHSVLILIFKFYKMNGYCVKNVNGGNFRLNYFKELSK